jgi:hypothetical protein
MSFSDRQAPPSKPVGETIPIGIRRTVIDILVEWGFKRTEIWDFVRTRQGWADWENAGEDIAERYGSEAGKEYREEYQREWIRRGNFKAVPPHRVEAEPALLAIPTPFFLDAIQHAIDSLRWQAAENNLHYNPDPVDQINGIFVRRGVAYRVEWDGEVKWHGNEAAYKLVVGPARSLLGEDSRLAGARSEFEDALKKLRQGSPKDLEDAIDEAAMSVESMMKVLLDAHSIPRPAKETAEPLWTALRDGGVVPTPTKEAVLAPSHLRNVLSGHGTGANPRALPPGTPVLAVQSAASTLLYLGTLLP